MTSTINRLLTYFYLMSTVVVLCDYNENIFVCSYVVCAMQIIAMLCICREFHDVSVL